LTDRLTKQQLKRDPLMDRTAETADFIAQHTRTLVFGLIALVVLAAGIAFYRTASRRAQESAAGVLADARIDYSRNALEPAAARLDDLMASMGGTRAGRQGLLLYGNIRYDQGRYDEAESFYRDALKHYADDPFFGPIARRGLAASLENQDKFAEAAAVYQALADAAEGDDPMQANYLLAVARNRRLAGDTPQALEIYESVSKDPEASTAAQTAKLLMAEFGPAPPAIP